MRGEGDGGKGGVRGSEREGRGESKGGREGRGEGK